MPRSISSFRTPFAAFIAATWMVVAPDARVDAQRNRRSNADGCTGRVIRRIDVIRRPPYQPDSGAWNSLLAQRATRLHTVTKAGVIRRFLLQRVGEKCDPIRIAESGRILRAQPFLAEANIRLIPADSGGVIVQVSTLDEVSAVVDGGASARGPHIRAARLGQTNLGGNAITAITEWRHGEVARDTYGAQLIDYQLFGQPYQLTLEGYRREVGGDWFTGLSKPFLTDLQRFSWRATLGRVEEYRFLRRGVPTNVGLRLIREYADVGGVIRVGPPGRFGVVGLSLSKEIERPGMSPVIVGPTGLVDDTTTALMNQFRNRHATRVNLLGGARSIGFATAHGLETVDAWQDIRIGQELAFAVGRGINAFSHGESDLFLSGDVYLGAGNGDNFVAMEMSAEGRKPQDRGAWDGVLMSGRGAWYMRLAARNVIETNAEWTAGWRQRVPFQLSFADPEGGLPGYAHSRVGGGRRLIASVEDRQYVGQVRQFASVAAAGFVDAGRLWAGDALLGANTPVSYSVGVSILAATPIHSRRTWRLDLAVPLTHGAEKHWEVRLANLDFTRVFWRDPKDVRSSRERAVPTSVFVWP